MNKKTSQARLNANRANATQSTGPRTPEGKSRSSRNALSHGLTAQTVTPQDLTALGEDASLLPSLIAAFTCSFQPTTEYELHLIHHLAELRLRLSRCTRMETGLLDPNIGPITGDHDKPTINTAHAEAFLARQSTFLNLCRYESSLSRAFDRTHKQLLSLRKEKLAPAPVPDKTNPIPLENKEPPAAPSIRTGEHIPPPEPAKEDVELIWIGPDGKELPFSIEDRERRQARKLAQQQERPR
jgi:hypothetical protein